MLALLLVASLLVVGVVHAQESEEPLPNDEDYAGDADGDSDVVSNINARAFFQGEDGAAPSFPAGEKVGSTIAFSNDLKNAPYTVFFVSGFIARLGDHNPMQNFSGTRQEALVQPGETATFKYTFTPDKMLDPQDYNLVLRLFFTTDSNKTFAAVAYNASVTIADPLGTDPRTVATFATIAAIFGAVGYLLNLRWKKSSKSRPRASAAVAAESGTKDNTYDKDYVSDEHIKFAEAIAARKSSQSPSKSPNVKSSKK